MNMHQQIIEVVVVVSLTVLFLVLGPEILAVSSHARAQTFGALTGAWIPGSNILWRIFI